MARGSIIPEENFPEAFQYMGSAATTFIVFSGILISSLGLTDIIDPTIWVLSALTGMVIAYSMRAYISHRFLIVGFCTASLSIALCYSFIIFELPARLEIVESESLNLTLQTFVLFSLMNFCFSAIVVSHRRKYQQLKSALPDRMLDKIRDSVSNTALFYESFEYDVEVSHQREKKQVRIDMKIDFKLRNLTGATQLYVSRYPSAADGFDLRAAVVDGDAIDLEDPNLAGRDGVEIRQQIPAKSTSTMSVRIVKIFAERDNDFYTAYDYPVDLFQFRAFNHDRASLDFWLEPLAKQALNVRRSGNAIEWDPVEPLLPFQGVRLLWKLKKKGEQGG